MGRLTWPTTSGKLDEQGRARSAQGLSVLPTWSRPSAAGRPDPTGTAQHGPCTSLTSRRNAGNDARPDRPNAGGEVERAWAGMMRR